MHEVRGLQPPPALAHGLSTEPRILVVDDEPVNIRLLERVLARAWPADIRGVTDPRLACETFDAFRPDLVLLDLHMPHVDGWTLLEDLRGRGGPADLVPIIVLTADVSPEARRRSLELGATDLLTKPFDHTEILLRIRNVIRTRALHLRIRDHAANLDRIVSERTAQLDSTIEELQRVDEQRRNLLARLVDAEERDRVRLAAEIHDDQMQHMAAVGMRVAALQGTLAGDPESRAALDRLQESIASATGRLRHLLFELRPPSLDRDGLRMAILEYAHGGGGDEGPAVTVEDSLDREPAPEARAVAYRILHEALANARRRGHARHVKVSLLSREGGLLARVTDDGVASVLEPENEGEVSTEPMRERAELAGGWLRIRGAPTGGTEVEFWIPV
jgi:signal transduction histidine kinase